MELCILQAMFHVFSTSVLRSHSVGQAVYPSWRWLDRRGGERIVSPNVGPGTVAPLQRQQRRAPR